MISDKGLAELPGVIVLGVDTQIGLAVVRDLGMSKIPVYGIGRSQKAVGLYSHYLRAGYVHPSRDESLINLMNDIARRAGARFIMTVSESDILFLNQSADQLDGLIALIPSQETIRLVIDKAQVYEIAERHGIEVPCSTAVSASGELLAGADELHYPVVLKWSDPAKVMPLLRSHGLSFNKAEYCHGPQELKSALSRYKHIGVFPLVQSYCPGHGLGQMIYMHKGMPVLKFQHHRLHEWPPEGGYSTLCESAPCDEHSSLMDKSVSLLREIGWEGPAMVEYRYDSSSGRATLMEINGRFWGSLPLAFHSGARFPWILYNAMGLGCVPLNAELYTSGVRCKFLFPDVKRLFRLLFQSDLIQDKSLRFSPVREFIYFIAYFFNPRNTYYLMSWRDPWPLVMDLYFTLKRGARNVVRR